MSAAWRRFCLWKGGSCSIQAELVAQNNQDILTSGSEYFSVFYEPHFLSSPAHTDRKDRELGAWENEVTWSRFQGSRQRWELNLISLISGDHHCELCPCLGFPRHRGPKLLVPLSTCGEQRFGIRCLHSSLSPEILRQGLPLVLELTGLVRLAD